MPVSAVIPCSHFSRSARQSLADGQTLRTLAEVTLLFDVERADAKSYTLRSSALLNVLCALVRLEVKRRV